MSMYAAHFGLHRPPFNNTPDPTFYYSTPDHEEALATLEYATLERKGFVLVTGEVGSGKTLIGRMFLRRIESRAQTAIITHTHLSGRQLLAAICSEFELDAPPQASNLDLTHILQNYLLQQFARDRSVVVLLDEAQNLPEESFEELRMLSNLEADDAKLLQVCFLGQPELRQRFAQPRMRQLKQRLFRQFHLPALTLDQTAEYIRYRLTVAGCKRDPLFSPEAVRRVFNASQGIPRVINQICDNALLAAYAQGAEFVDDRFVREVLERDGQFDNAGTARAMPEARMPAEALDADHAGFSHERVNRRIEHIYGTAPAVAHVAAEDSATPSVPCAAATLAITDVQDQEASLDNVAQQESRGVASRLDRQQETINRAADQWRIMREKMAGYEKHLATAVMELSARCHSTQEQIEALSGACLTSAEIEQVRAAHQAQTSRVLEDIARQRRALEQFVDQVESRWVCTRDELNALANQSFNASGLGAIESRLQDKVREVAQRFDQYQQRIDQLVQEVAKRCDQTSTRLEELRLASEQNQAKALAHLAGQIEAREDQIHSLSLHVERRLAAAHEALDALKHKAATGDELDRLRTEQNAALSEAIQRFTEQTRELSQLHNALAKQSQATSAEHQSRLNDLGQRLAEQVRQVQDLRNRLLKHFAALQQRIEELARQAVTRPEMDALRQAQADQHAEVQAQLQADRAAIQQAVETIASSKASTEAVEQLRTRQTSDVAQLLDLLEAQRRETQGQLEQVLACWVETQERIEQVSAETAQVEAVDQLRQQLLQDKERVLELIAAQRREIESQVDGVNTRYQQLLERVNELPDDLVDAEDLRNVQAEHNRQIRRFAEESTARHRQFGQAIKDLASRIEQARQKLDALASRAASVQDIQELRDEQKQIADSIIEQIERQRDLQQQRWADLDRRCESLDQDLKRLAESTTPAAVFQDLAQSVTQNMASLEAELEQVRDQHGKNLHNLAQAVDRTSSRVDTLERTRQPKPVRIKLAPEAGQALADLILAAREERKQLRTDLEDLRRLAAQVHTVASEISKVMSEWRESAATVQQQADQLRASAKTARGLLLGLKRCNEALDARLTSPQWQTHLEQGQKLIAQLEQASQAAQTATNVAATRLRQLVEETNSAARAAARRLAALRAQSQALASEFGRAVDQRRQTLEAIAKDVANLADRIQPGQNENGESPKGADGPRDRGVIATPIEWPRFRTHQVQVG